MTIDPNQLYQYQWLCEGETKAVVLLVHGLNEHCRRYENLAKVLNQNHYALYAIDLPGHGRSPGIRGHIDKFHDFEDSVLHLYNQIKRTHPSLPIFLLGHSMGGLIASHLLLNHQKLFKGAVLSAAALQSPKQPSSLEIKIISAISAIFPSLKMIKLGINGLSKDQQVIEQYLSDPLINKGRLSARLMVELFNTMQVTMDGASDINLPVLIMHGSVDPVTHPDGSKKFSSLITSTSNTLKIYEGLFHEIFNEPEAQNVFNDVIQWLNEANA